MKKMRLLLPAALTAIGAYLSAVPLTRGLVNLGNTCFMNATLQALAHVPEFVTEVEKQKEQVLPAVLDTTFKGMLQAAHAYSPDGFVEIVRTDQKGDGFGLNQGARQEDAHEFLGLLLNKIFQTGPAGSMFEVQTEQRGHCPNHHEVHLVEEPQLMLELSLAIGATSLEALLHTYFAPEELEYQCQYPGCSQTKRTTRRSLFKSGPYLIIQLKRTTFDLVTQVLQKNKKPIGIPAQELSLGAQGTYDLFATVIHDGANFACGHYFTFARDLANAADYAWYRYNDGADPEKISQAAMQSWLTPKAGGSATPYLLFYKKRTFAVPPTYTYQGGSDALYYGDLTDLQKDVLEQKIVYARLEDYLKDKLLPACFADQPLQQEIVQELGPVLDVETVHNYDVTAEFATGAYDDIQSLVTAKHLDSIADVVVLSTNLFSGQQAQVPAVLWQKIIQIQGQHYLALAAVLKKSEKSFSYSTDDLEVHLSPKVDAPQKPALVIYYKLDAQRRAGVLMRTLRRLPTLMSNWLWGKK